MSRIVIHIGTHKTATTHLQDTFHKNRALLKTHGVTFPYIGWTRGQHGLASAWIRMPMPSSSPAAIRNSMPAASLPAPPSSPPCRLVPRPAR